MVDEEVLEADAEYQRDTEEGGERREQAPALDFGEQRRRQPRVLAELHQTDLLLQSQGAQLRADVIPLESINQGFRQHNGSFFLRLNNRRVFVVPLTRLCLDDRFLLAGKRIAPNITTGARHGGKHADVGDLRLRYTR